MLDSVGMSGPQLLLDALRVRFAPNSRPGLRRGATTQFAYQTRQLNSKAQLAISRIALDQKVEGSNPSSPSNQGAMVSVLIVGESGEVNAWPSRRALLDSRSACRPLDRLSPFRPASAPPRSRRLSTRSRVGTNAGVRNRCEAQLARSTACLSTNCEWPIANRSASEWQKRWRMGTPAAGPLSCRARLGGPRLATRSERLPIPRPRASCQSG